MATFNVNRSIKDSSYRYKMPAIITKIEPIPKRRNRSQTMITNLEKISKSLGVQGVTPDFILKFLSQELGVSSKINKELRKSNTVKHYILLTSVQPQIIQPKMDVFIQNWILCRTCDNPETDLWKIEQKIISQKCYACGKLNEILVVDKFGKFLVDKLPDSEPVPPKKYQKLLDKPEKSCLSDKKVSGWESDDDFELEMDDFSAIDRTMKLYQTGETTVNLTSLKNFPESSRNYAFLKYLKECKSDSSKIKFLLRSFQLESALIKPVFQKHLKWTKKKFDFTQLESKIKNHAEFFEAISYLDTINCERKILTEILKIIDFNRKKLLEFTPKILFLLYDEDVICEEVILEWYDGKFKVLKHDIEKRVKEKCGLLVDWLRNAEEEHDSEDEVSQKVSIKLDIEKNDDQKYDYQTFNYPSDTNSEDESDLDISKI